MTSSLIVGVITHVRLRLRPSRDCTRYAFSPFSELYFSTILLGVWSLYSVSQKMLIRKRVIHLGDVTHQLNNHSAFDFAPTRRSRTVFETKRYESSLVSTLVSRCMYFRQLFSILTERTLARTGSIVWCFFSRENGRGCSPTYTKLKQWFTKFIFQYERGQLMNNWVLQNENGQLK